MKLYLITGDYFIRWVASQSDAATARKDAIAEGEKRKDLNTYTVEVPTNKEGLLEFLNDYRGSTEQLIATRKLTGA